mmetsp:Transcript_30142/g.52512  ORF Transcript_30142/g.52512 Transcript_30142/m.52512 type:complete len:85 (+) Transcript_30142:3-257(+)
MTSCLMITPLQRYSTPDGPSAPQAQDKIKQCSSAIRTASEKRSFSRANDSMHLVFLLLSLLLKAKINRFDALLVNLNFCGTAHI